MGNDVIVLYSQKTKEAIKIQMIFSKRKDDIPCC